MINEDDEIAVWDVWAKFDDGFEQVMSIRAEEVQMLEAAFLSMRCGTSLIIF